jgi:hypothetical protein
MSYSCSDFTDDLCRVLNVQLSPNASDDDVQELANLAMNEVWRLRRFECKMRQVFETMKTSKRYNRKPPNE